MTPAQLVALDAMRSAWPEETVARMLWAAEKGALVSDHRELLAAAVERIEEDRAAYGESYGSWHGGDPRHFQPDPECSTVEERADHALACAAAARGDPGADDLPVLVIPGAFAQDQRFGLGTTVFPDADGDGVITALRALLPP